MLNLFGRKKGSAERPVLNAAPKGNSPANRNQISQTSINSIAKMRETIRNLEKREDFLSVKAKAQYEEAIEKNKVGDKKGAAACLMKKKLFDNEVNKIIQMRNNLEAQILSIETANVTLVANDGMQAGLAAQRRLSTALNADAIAEMHQDIDDHLATVDEVSKILSNGFNSVEVYDEDELLKELYADGESAPPVMQEIPSSAAEDESKVISIGELANALPEVPLSVTMPEAPTGKLSRTQFDDSEYDLRRLEQEMGL